MPRIARHCGGCRRPWAPAPFCHAGKKARLSARQARANCWLRRASANILGEIHARPRVGKTMLIPAVAEPQLHWQISGRVLLRRQRLGGERNTHQVEPGVLFLITTPDPYELRWRSIGPEPIVVMHATVSLRLSLGRQGSFGGRVPKSLN